MIPKISRCALLFTVLFTTFFVNTAAADEYEFAVKNYRTLGLNDPLLVRAMLLVSKPVAQVVPGDLYPLFAACNAAVAREFLAAGMDPNARMPAGETALFYVRDTATARMLLDAGADVNVYDYGGDSPLACAANGDITELLLAAGVDMEPYRTGKFPAGEEDTDTCRPVLNPLNFAPDAKAVRLLVAAGLDVNANTKPYLQTPLCCAKNADVTRALLEAGADPRYVDRDGMTPLHYAPDAESVRLLLAAGADVNAVNVRQDEVDEDDIWMKNNAGVTPLVTAVNVYIARDRVESDRSDDYYIGGIFTSYSEPAPTDEEIAAGCLAKARILLEAGACADVIAYDGCSLLMLTDDPAMTKLLIEAGADVNVLNKDGRTALMKTESDACAELLLAAGADPRVKDNKGKTPLMLARSFARVKLLIAAGVDPLTELENPLDYIYDIPTAELYLKLLREAGREVIIPEHIRYWDFKDTLPGDILADKLMGYITSEKDRQGAVEWEKSHDLLALLRLLVPAGADVRGMLHNARKAETVRLLLDAGARVDEKGAYGNTPLHSMLDDDATVEAVRLVLEAGADVNAENENGCTPLMYLVGFANPYVTDVPALAKMLIAAGADVNALPGVSEQPMGMMYRKFDVPLCMARDWETVQTLIDARADVNLRGKKGKMPLHIQVESPPIVRTLIAAGADVNARDDDGRTPLFHADNVSVERMLIAAGADINAKNKNGETVLFCNFAEADKQYLERMTQAGADFHVCNDDGRTLLHLDLEPWQTRYLVAKGLDVNARDEYNITPLHATENLENMKILLEAGADLSIKDELGNTPIFGRDEISEAKLELFLKHGQDVNARDWAGDTLLHHVVDYSVPVTRMLIAAGADVNARDDGGRTPYFNAHSQEMRDVLIEAGADPNVVDKYGDPPYFDLDDEEEEEECDDENFQ